jgi:thioredoxin-like negative regulator of GroEL
MARRNPGTSYIETLIAVSDFGTARAVAYGYEGEERKRLLALIAAAETEAVIEELIAAGKLLEAEAVIAQLPSGPAKMAADALLTQAHIKNALAAAGLPL